MCSLQPAGGETPGWAAGETPGPGATPAGKQRSRWDETPAGAPGGLGATPAAGATPGATPGWGATPAYGVTPVGGLGMETPTPSQLPKVRLQLVALQHGCVAVWHCAALRSACQLPTVIPASQ